MILEELSLCNFRLFRDEQRFNFTPSRNNGTASPIVLIGGINGGGKTTILDAIQLVLYGSRAACVKRANNVYEDFLRSCIHRGTHPRDWASVALTFRYSSAGQQHVYRVRRVWTERGKRIREKLYVFKDGHPDPWLANHWNELVEELIPLGISQLFFFDAEQIRFLAEDDNTSERLGSAIKSLLGLDLAERLIADASVVEARLITRMNHQEDQDALKELTSELESKNAAIRTKKTERATLENELLRAEEALRKAEEQFSRVGGHHWQLRRSRQERLAELQNLEREIQRQLANLAASELPLALLTELLDRVRQQHTLEQQCKEASLIQQVLEERDKEILGLLRNEKVPDYILSLLKSFQDSDRAKRAIHSDIPFRLMLSHANRSLLDYLLSHGLSHKLQQSRDLLDKLSTICCEREALERSLDATPEDAEVRKIAEELKSASKEEALLKDKAARIDAEIKLLQFQRDNLERRLRKLRRSYIDREIASEEAARMAKLAIRTQTTMREFLKRATSAKIDRLSELVTESFRFLLRKKTLVHRVEIDPVTFSITLYDDEHKVVPKRELSEGEKQLFAISVLWGLARACSHPLPAIIDTPMARLDAEHRYHLVSRYFPNASHQVIILSTDTEVNEEYYRQLKPFIARAYHLDYNEAQKVTVAQEGYFWIANSLAVDGA
jgi:DNA sulfur modification protein DndD